MAYQVTNISAITDIPAIVSAFAIAQGWSVNTTTPSQPIFTLPTTDSLIQFKLSAAISSYDHTLTWTASGSAVPTSTANTRSPKLAPTSGTNPVVPNPAKVHLFISPAPSETPYLIISIEYNSNLYRHLYLGRMERLGNYSGGEIIAGEQGPYTSYSANVSYRDYNRVQHLFQSRSAVWANTACGGVRVDHADNPNPWRKFLGYQTGTITSLPSDAVIGGLGDSVNDGFAARGESPFAGINPLISLNLFAVKPITSDISFVPLGRPPGIRLVNIKNIDPGASMTIGGVTWRVFPAMSKNDSQTMPAGLGNWRSYESSYYFGYALREN